jgi:hypothetical protein
VSERRSAAALFQETITTDTRGGAWLSWLSSMGTEMIPQFAPGLRAYFRTASTLSEGSSSTFRGACLSATLKFTGSLSVRTQ